KHPPLPFIKDQTLYERVFVHKSVVNGKTYLDQNDLINSHNERLEFLGDSVLNNLVTLIIYDKFPSASEGKLTKMRSQLIDNHTLTQFSFEYGFDKRLKTKTDEEILKTGDQKVYADIFEAYIGALSVERGLDLREIKDWLEKLYAPKLEAFKVNFLQESVNKEAKSELYSIVGTASSHPLYVVVEEGNGSHDFVVECRMGNDVLGRAKAPSQKEAGLRAAMDALKNRQLLE
nr:Chain A, RNase III [Scheffersomyces stipitis CBS 6054]7DEY_B Chain B, RNase III [Scheffersomyces stipitis CBS 6054]7DEY_C Chain C, RNase III [Scheffersomyces stipitis CBS 6054]7DEY_D Chain D, RNase III [Scheffersomyces stipitis CBS 6054]